MRGRSAAVPMAMIVAASLAGAAHAVDGVIEINQAKVMAGGGFPLTISSGGSYRLTSNLDIVAGGQSSPENRTAIQVVVGTEPSTVDIDLNGFSIVGPVVCSFGGSLSCSPEADTGIGHGIYASVGALRLHDGVIQGFAGNCVQATTGAQNQVANLDVKWCGNGVVTGHAVLENVTVMENRGQGVSAYRAVLHRIVASRNTLQGIVLGSNSILRDCSSTINGSDDVYAEGGSLVLDCSTDAP